MEAPSARGHRGRVPWQGLLLAVSLCIFWVLPTSGKFIFDFKNSHLIIKLLTQPKTAECYTWFKGDIINESNQIASYTVKTRLMTPGPARDDRQTVLPNGTLAIMNVTKKDTGYYTVQIIITKYIRSKASILLFFLEPVTSTVAPESIVKVRAGTTVTIMCLRSRQNDAMYWIVSDHNLSLRKNMILSRDNTFLTITSIKKEDSGKYHCLYLNSMWCRSGEYLILEVV